MCLCGEREEAWAADLSRLTAASLPGRPSKGWLHRGETGIRGNTWRHLGMGRSPSIQGDDMLRKAVLEKAWGGAGALYADHSRQPS